MTRPPSDKTLAKYGLTEAAWWAILEAQGNVCRVCQKLPPSGRLVVDHEHVRGWKKLPPEQRAAYVRGLLCWTCNFYYCGCGITIAKARAVVDYLSAYALRCPGEPARRTRANPRSRTG